MTNEEAIERVIKALGQKFDETMRPTITEKMAAYREQFNIPEEDAIKALVKSFGGDVKSIAGTPKPIAQLKDGDYGITFVGQILSRTDADYESKGEKRTRTFGYITDGNTQEDGNPVSIAYTSFARLDAEKRDYIKVVGAWVKNDRNGRPALQWGEKAAVTVDDGSGEVVDEMLASATSSPVEPKICTVGEILVGDVGVDTMGVVVSAKTKEITKGKRTKYVTTGILLDSTGSIQFDAWGQKPPAKDEYIHITDAHVKEYNGTPRLSFETSDFEKLDAPEELLNRPPMKLSDALKPSAYAHTIARVLTLDKKVASEGKPFWVGVLGDLTGMVPFTAWNDYGLEVDGVYDIDNAYILDRKGIVLVMGDNATVKKAAKKIAKDVPSGDDLRAVMGDNVKVRTIAELLGSKGGFNVAVFGRVMAVRDGSGYIVRCPDCKRVLKGGKCAEHGIPKTVLPDFRTKLILDDGDNCMDVVLPTELTGELLGRTIEDAKGEIAMRGSMDIYHPVLEDKLLFKEVRVVGNADLSAYGLQMRATGISPGGVVGTEDEKAVLLEKVKNFWYHKEGQ